MKSNAHQSLYFSLYPLNEPNHPESSAKPVSSDESPYLKAILSAKGGSTRNRAIVKMINSDRLAALRYIQDSEKWRKK